MMGIDNDATDGCATGAVRPVSLDGDGARGGRPGERVIDGR